MEDGL